MKGADMDDLDARRSGASVPRDPPQRLPSVQSSAHPDEVTEFSEFYRGFVPTLVAFLVWQGARLPDATDIAQETMIKAYQRWSEIDHPKAWARTVASRALVRRIASIEEDPAEQLPEHNLLLPLSINVEAWEQRHEVLRVLDRLPPRQRQAMAWTLEGYTPAEIATQLQITADAVRASLMKARRTLAAYLSTTGDQR
jgi:RNA polymerase sigma factor (sigma-70 family)